MRNIILLISYFITVNFLILSLVLYSMYLMHQKKPYYGYKVNEFKVQKQFKALPQTATAMVLSPQVSDARVDVLKEFFKRYNSPLLAESEHIVKMADKYHLDYRLIPAIAMQESTLCKKMPKNSHNCWGFGIYGGKVTKFVSYTQAIETISKTLAKEYVGKGLINPDSIMTKYTPSSNGSWADAVNLVMERIHQSL